MTVDDSLSAALAAAGVGSVDTKAGVDSGTDPHRLASGGVNTDPHRLTSLVRALEAMGQAEDLGPNPSPSPSPSPSPNPNPNPNQAEYLGP